MGGQVPAQPSPKVVEGHGAKSSLLVAVADKGCVAAGRLLESGSLGVADDYIAAAAFDLAVAAAVGGAVLEACGRLVVDRYRGGPAGDGIGVGAAADGMDAPVALSPAWAAVDDGISGALYQRTGDVVDTGRAAMGIGRTIGEIA